MTDAPKRLSRRERQEQTRAQLLDAATDIIANGGVAAASIRGICEAAGYSQGAFYSNFQSMDDLLATVMEQHLRDEVAALRDLVAGTDHATLDAAISDLATRLADLSSESQWSLLWIELRLHALRDPGFANRHNASKELCYREFEQLLEDLVKRHALRPVLPPKEMAIGLYALWSGLALESKLDANLPRTDIFVSFFSAALGRVSS